MRPNGTRAKLAAGEPVYGCHVRYGDADLAEFVCWHPFDFVVIDGEHGTIDPATCAHMVRSAELRDVTPVVRVTTNQPSTVLRYMDTGAQGAQVPWVSTEAQARAAVAAVKYFPAGRRGLAGVRAADFGTGSLADYTRTANEETLVIIQVESAEALDDLDAICAVEGVDVVLIGAADLSQTLGVTMRMDAPELGRAIDRIAAAVDRSRAALGVMVNTAEEAAAWRERGASWIAIALEALLRPALLDYVGRVRG